MRIHFATLLLVLAACSSDGGDGSSALRAAAPAESTSPTQAPAPAQDPELPDAAEPAAFVDIRRPRWVQWEVDVPGGREARLQQLGIRPMRADSPVEVVEASEDYDPNGERVEDFHFVDFSGDGVADVIYDGAWFVRLEGGFGAREGSHIKLYQVIGGRGVEVMDHHGSIQRIWRGAPGQPVTFRTVHHGCCADPEWGIEYHRPVRRGDTVRYEVWRRVLGREGVEVPTRFWTAPRRFTVANDPYLLRATPRVQDVATGDEEWYSWEGRGNALAEYGRGARGTAIAERADSTGRVWWFVRMDGRTPPRDAQVEDDSDDPVPTDRVGWMSSRFLAAQP